MTMRRVDIMRKVLVGGLATSRTGGGNTKLYGEVPPLTQKSTNSLSFTPIREATHPSVTTMSLRSPRAILRSTAIDTPASFDFTDDYKMYCNPYDGHDALFEDVAFWYDGAVNKDGEPYTVYPRLPMEPSGACDYTKYDILNPLTTLTFVEAFVIKVDKNQAEEPEVFDDDGNIAGVVQRINDKARFGLEYFNKNGDLFELGKNQDSGVVASAIGGNLVDVITRVENEACDVLYTPGRGPLHGGTLLPAGPGQVLLPNVLFGQSGS